MLSGLYSAATAMDSAATQHEVVAQNLASAHLPGFRRAVVVSQTFESALSEAQRRDVRQETWGVADPVVVTDFSNGPTQHTGRKLDFALNGDGFFVVEGPNGPLYTRNGAFQMDAEGNLVTSSGLPVTGKNGPLAIPSTVPLSDVTVTKDGSLSSPDGPIGKLKIVSFENNSLLTPAGDTLFAAGPTREQASEAGVLQGAREQSNVSAVEELIHMIVGLRQFEAAQRALRTIDESVGKHTNPQLS